MLSLPAYLRGRKRYGETIFLLLVSFPALAVWTSLAIGGFGAQSLGNLVEVFVLLGCAVGLAYVKAYWWKAQLSTLVLAALLVVMAGSMRMLVPMIPE